MLTNSQYPKITSPSEPMPSVNIAVAVPTYKREKLLRRLIGSIPTSWHAFVSDNDSSLLPLKCSLGEHVTVSHSPNLIGMFANWNRALSIVSPEFTHVFIPSDDDLFLPNAKNIVDDVLKRCPDFDIYVFGCDLFDETGRTWRGYRPLEMKAFDVGDGFLEFELGVDARMPGILFRREFLDRIGVFDESLELTAADSDLVQRALLLGRSVFIPDVIGLYQIWSGSLTYSRQATDQWLSEVELWTSKIAELLRTGHQPPSRQVNIERYCDEIYARNLLAGLNNLYQKGEEENARYFLIQHRIPRHTKLMTRLRLLRMRWRLWKATV